MSVSDRKNNRDDRDRSSRLNIHTGETDSEIDGAYYDGIGAELKAERLRCGLHLHEVASRLRIREPHLEAIEAGRFGDLPGRIYAIGFVRSYAEFLGADGDVCITMFKSEVGPGGHSRKLVFPAPPSENRRPGWLTLAASLVLAGFVYGGWYVWQAEERQSAELVSEVPKHFVEQAEFARVRDESSLAGVSVANASESANPALSVDDQMAATSESASEITTLDLAVVGRVEDQASNAANATVAAEVDVQFTTPDAAMDEVVPVEPAVATSTAGETDQGSQADAAMTESAGVRRPAEEPEPVQVAAVVPPPIPVAKPQESNVPRVYGTANRDARIVVRATGKVQIFVKRLDGTTVLPHRVLQTGDLYRAPNRDDVILEADRMGALQLIVDGRLVGRGDSLTEPGNALALNANLLRSLGN